MKILKNSTYNALLTDLRNAEHDVANLKMNLKIAGSETVKCRLEYEKQQIINEELNVQLACISSQLQIRDEHGHYAKKEKASTLTKKGEK